MGMDESGLLFKTEEVAALIDGKELKRAWILLPSVNTFSQPFTFYKGAYYYLKDDLEREKWVIIKTPIFKMPDSRKR